VTAIIIQMKDMRQIDPATAPNRLREWRTRRGRTLEQLAEAMGTSRMQLSRLETGNRETTINWLEKAARALDVSVGDLLAHRHNATILSEGEAQLINKLRAMPPERASSVHAVAESMASYTAPPILRPLDAPRATEPRAA
jgi:transcriptional regulator with XRE-family HTH domain